MKLKVLFATACLAMSFAAVASAADADIASTSSAGNVKNVGNVSSNGVGVVQETIKEQTQMLAVNVNDTITINVTGAGEDVTVLSYKADEAEPDSNNIQYVDQYKTVDGSVEITYKIRELADKDGVYCLKINNGRDGKAETVYYKVGAPKLVTGTDATYYKKVDFTENVSEENKAYANTTSVGYLAKYNGNSGKVSDYGFNVSLDGGKTISQINPTDGTITVGGDFSFAITIFNIDDVSYIDKLTVTPIVNFKSEVTE